MPSAIIPFPPRPTPSPAPSHPDTNLASLVDELMGLRHQLLLQRDLVLQSAGTGALTPQVGTAFCDVIEALARSIDIVVFAVLGDRR